jgi:hypothetical protein
VAPRPGRPKTAIQRVSRRRDAASATGRKEAKRLLGLGVWLISPSTSSLRSSYWADFGPPSRGLQRSSHRNTTKTRPGAVEPRPSEPARYSNPQFKTGQSTSASSRLEFGVVCHWLSEPFKGFNCQKSPWRAEPVQDSTDGMARCGTPNSKLDKALDV